MATELAVRPFPLERFHLRGANARHHVGAVTEFTRAPSGCDRVAPPRAPQSGRVSQPRPRAPAPCSERRHTFRGYFFFAPDTFAPYPPGAHNATGQYAADPSAWREGDRLPPSQPGRSARLAR